MLFPAGSPGMATMLPKALEIERHQLADYARVDYAITKGEDEVAALEELCLGPNELRREASVVRDRTVLAVREVRNNMAKRAITAKNMQGSLVESLRQRSRFAVADTVDASLRARCFASLRAYRPLRSSVTSSTRSKRATSLAPKVFALNF
jgi:hypothetical protein